ncbi:21097_t:CDS:1, partial [Gigaspora margarita]
VCEDVKEMKAEIKRQEKKKEGGLSSQVLDVSDYLTSFNYKL